MWRIGVGVRAGRVCEMKLVGEKSPFILCIQETKLIVCDDSMCSSFCGDSSHDFSYRPSVGASRVVNCVGYFGSGGVVIS